MKLYTVDFLTAGKKGEVCSIDNSGYNCYLNKIKLAIWNNPEGVCVLSKQVRSETPIGAIIKFIEWQEKGLPQSFLTKALVKNQNK